MVITVLAFVVGIGLLMLIAVAAMRLQPRRAGRAGGGDGSGGDVTWMSGADSGSEGVGGSDGCGGTDGGADGGGGCD